MTNLQSYRMSLLVILLLGFNNVISQSISIGGIVSDSLNVPIQYANVGLLNRSIGTVTNENGKFHLTVMQSQLSDTLKISCLGYKPEQFVLNRFILDESDKRITLETHIEVLEEILINPSKLKSFTKGTDRTKTKNKVFYAIPSVKNLNLGSEIGRKFKTSKKKPSLLSEYSFYIKENNFEHIKFRINVYSIEKNRPNKLINSSNIFVDVKNKYTGWVKVNLSSFDLKVDQNIIITAQWIESSKDGNNLSLPIIIPSIGAKHYYKYGAQNKWKIFASISTPMTLSYEQ